jgi:hypothetical protein
MARRRRSASAGAKIIRMPVRQAAPIIKVSAPRAPAKRKRTHHRRRSSVGGGIVQNSTLQYALGGLLYGFVVKSGLVQKLPAVPVIGRTGLAAIGLDYWARHGGGDMVRKTANAAAVIAGFQFGSTGSVLGQDDASPDSYQAAGFDTMGFDTMGDEDYTEGDDELEGDDDE